MAIRPDHPRRRTEVTVCLPGGLRRVVLHFKFYYNRSSGLAAVGGRKSPFPTTLAIGLYNSLYYRTAVICPLGDVWKDQHPPIFILGSPPYLRN